MTKPMTRGELARRCGVDSETIRYYEARGLLPKAARSASNYRLYDDEAVRRLEFVRRAQELGFKLAEIRELLDLRAAPGACCANVKDRARAKIADIDERIGSLRGMRRALSKLVAACDGAGSINECPILDALDSRARRARQKPRRSTR